MTRQMTPEQVRRSEERLRLAMEDARVAVWEYDFVAGSMSRTDNHDALYGLPPQETWVIETFLNATHPEDRHLANHHIQRCVVAGGPDDYAFDFRVVLSDNSVRWLAVTGHVAARDEQGTATLVRGTLIDVTSRKESEATLQAAVRLRDEFVQVASHELNTPLTSLALNIGRARKELAMGRGDVEARLAKCEQQIGKMAELVKQLLDVGRLSSGRFEIVRAPTSLADVVRGVVDDFTAQAQRAGCTLTLEVVTDATGSWDRARLAQVVANLVMNAVKYGAGKPVVVTVAADEKHARVVVADEGPGIEPSELERIFEKFSRAAATSGYGGLGLGLWVAREIVHAHEGRLRAESEHGAGARFTVELPRA